MFEVLSLCTNAGSQPWSPLFNGLVNDTLLQLSPDTELQVINVPYCFLVDTFLYQPPNPVVDCSGVKPC